MSWLVFAVFTAIFSSARDLVAKRVGGGIRPSFIAMAQYAIATVLIGGFTLSKDLPTLDAAFFPSLVLAAALLSSAAVFYFRAIELSDVSLMIPLRSLTLVMILFMSPIVIGESITLPGAVGVFSIVAGLYIASRSPQHGNLFATYVASPGTKYMLVSVALFAFCALSEKVGINASSGPFFVTFECLLATLFLSVVVLRKNKLSIRQIRGEFFTILPVGLLFSIMMTCQSYAYELGPVSYAAAIKRSGVILTVLYGCLVYGEDNLPQRLLGSAAVVAGATLIAFAT